MGQANPSDKTDITVIGAGIIGLSCAWELAKRGAKVSIFEKRWPPRGASWAAAGMLAPVSEAATEIGGHECLFDLCMESAALWPNFAADLETASGIDLGYRSGPSLTIATSADRLASFEAASVALTRRNIPHKLLTEAEARSLEPSLGPTIVGGLRYDIDGQIDNRAVMNALIKACEKVGVKLASQPTPDGAATLETIGWQASDSRPVKGQLMSLLPTTGGPRHVLNDRDLYIVPKADRIVIGATSEPGLSDNAVDISATDTLLRRAVSIVPALAEADILERWAGIRPATDDRAPIMSAENGSHYVATGHYRNGILLAPITARIMADMILEGRTSDLAAAFSPDRFAPAD
ncbi:MAG: FAD-dependent oxidoreductase [Pseudomonadota bacterium]